MPRRYYPLVTNEIYHVFNRSVGREVIFSQKICLRKILEIINYYRYPQSLSLYKFKNLNDNLKQEYLFRMVTKQPLIEMYAFSFMPNHFHFLIKQLHDRGIPKFITNSQNSFAKYFNIKNDRHGSLFQIQFKAKRIETDEQFLHVSRYIHLNPVTDYLMELPVLLTSPCTSLPYYQNGEKSSFLSTERVLSFFNKDRTYLDFVSDQVDYQRTLAEIKDLLLE